MVLKISKVIYFLLIFYLMFFQEAYFTIPYLSNILGFLLILFIFIYKLKNKIMFKRIKKYFPLELNLLLLYGISSLIFGLFIAIDINLLINSIYKYFEHIILLYVIFYYSLIDERIDFPLNVFLFVALLSAFKTVFDGYDYHRGRISLGIRNNPNTLGIMMVVGSGFLLYKLKTHNILKTIIIFALVFLFSYVIILTGSRKAFLAFLLIFALWLGILILVELQKLNFKKQFVYFLIALASILIFNFAFYPFIKDSVLWGRLLTLLKTGDDIRFDMYKEAITYFKCSPLIGIGYNQFRVLSKYQTYSHSTYGEVLANTGIIGFIIYFSVYFIILIKYLIKIFQTTYHKHQYVILLSLFGTLLFLGIGIIHFYGKNSLYALAIIIAFPYLKHKNTSKKKVSGKIAVIIKILKKPRLIIKHLGDKKVFNFLPDETYLKLVYWGETGKKLNLENPKTYNEKLQWLKLNDRKEIYLTYVDKLAVRKYIEEKLGKKYLIPLIAVYDTYESIKWDKLPKQFVLKCTHASGANIICRDKDKLDKKVVKKKLKKWLNKNWYYFGREWPYKYVKPRILIEKYLADNIIDYKIMCFNGIPKIIQVHQNRYQEDYTMDYYTVDWEKTKISKKGVKNSAELLNKPKNLDEMLEIASILAQDTYFVRIDLYNVKGKIYFGEITLYPTSGFALFDDEQVDLLLGSWIKL